VYVPPVIAALVPFALLVPPLLLVLAAAHDAPRPAARSSRALASAPVDAHPSERSGPERERRGAHDPGR